MTTKQLERFTSWLLDLPTPPGQVPHPHWVLIGLFLVFGWLMIYGAWRSWRQ